MKCLGFSKKKNRFLSLVLSIIMFIALMQGHLEGIYGAETLMVEINGYQISVTQGGFRTVYSVYDPNNNIASVGLIYGLADEATENDMYVGSANSTVYAFEATEEGKSSSTYSSNPKATSYVMTMKFIDKAEFYDMDIMVRAYIKLKNGGYVYSDCRTTSVYDIASILFDKSAMSNSASHEYLYNNILTVVNPDYVWEDYGWGNTIVKPGEENTTKQPEETTTEKTTEAPTEAPTEPPTEAPTEPPTELPTEEPELEIIVPDSPLATGAPAKPQVTHDQWDTDGDYTITANMWWGNNATCYVLYEKKGESGTYKAIATGTLVDDSPNQQSYSISITGKTKPGTYFYYIEAFNSKGSVKSDEISLTVGGGSSSSILLDVIDDDEVALQHVMSQGVYNYAIETDAVNPNFTVISSNTSAVEASISNGVLTLNAKMGGRTGIKIVENTTGEERYFGVRVRESDGRLSALPNYLALGQVSEDSDTDLTFWRDTDTDDTNKRVDIRYIYINGGPIAGWQSWNPDDPGKRVRVYIQESLKLGMIPYFVYYNIPDGSESYDVDLAHINDISYMEAYYKDLVYFLEVCDMYDYDETVGIILEPDFLGYMMQLGGSDPRNIAAVGVQAAYSSGILKKGVDPDFPNTVEGIVESINYIISTKYPTAQFGWQFNTWAYANGVPSQGLMHATETLGYSAGLQFINAAAVATANFYMNAGILEYGADFISIDKYGLDGAYQGGAAENPATSNWLWNADLWSNYLYYTKILHETTGMPVTLWQIPVGHLNHSLESNPYTGGTFTDLTNKEQNYEDSAPTYFFGDTFDAMTTTRFKYFTQNVWNDTKISGSGTTVTYGSHMQEAADAGVTCILFGAGVGSSTDAVGDPPLDHYWWITKAQRYYDNPVWLK